MKYKVTIHVGVFWNGGTYSIGTYPWFWLAWLRAKLELIRFPYRAATIHP